jgi:hypothetical protein
MTIQSKKDHFYSAVYGATMALGYGHTDLDHTGRLSALLRRTEIFRPRSAFAGAFTVAALLAAPMVIASVPLVDAAIHHHAPSHR